MTPDEFQRLQASLMDILDRLKGVETRLDILLPTIKEELQYLQRDHSKLKRNFWMLVAFMLGSGLLGGSLLTLMKVL